MSGSSLAATTGIAAGVLLLATATAGFHDLAGLRPALTSNRDPGSAREPRSANRAGQSSGSRFPPRFNPATGERIEFTSVHEGRRRSMAGTFQLDGACQAVPSPSTSIPTRRSVSRLSLARRTSHLTARSTSPEQVEAVVVPAGVPHSEGNRGSVEIEGVVELRPALHSKEFHEAVAGLVADGKTDTAGRPQESPAARCHLLALPPRKQGHLTAYLGPEPPAPATVGA